MTTRTGICECGCGAPTLPATCTDRRRGNVEGQPQRFVQGHSSRRGRRDPNRTDYGKTKSELSETTERIHRVRAERALGKPLPSSAVVHHADGSKDDDAPLVICQDQSYHVLLHARTRIVRAGGDPDRQRVCSRCRRPVDVSEMSRDSKRPDGVGCRCAQCSRDHAKEWSRRQPRKGHHKLFLTYQGQTKSVKEWARVSGISYVCLRQRMRQGCPESLLFAPALKRQSPQRKVGASS